MATEDPLVRYGLISAKDLAEIKAAVEANDVPRFSALAIPLCESNVPLFSVLFMGRAPVPFLWKEWKKIQSYRRLLIRLPRSHSKTSSFTFDQVIHRICYSVVPDSVHEDPRVLVMFESRDRANDRMLSFRQFIQGGGPGGLIGAVFRGAKGTRFEGMGIAEIAAACGEWSNKSISLPHPRGLAKPDPNVRSLAPGEATVGFHPYLVIADDLVGPKTAASSVLRAKLSDWWNNAIEPMFKPFTTVLVPHTIFHEDDLNQELAKHAEYYLMQMPALDRFPDREDFLEVKDSEGVLTGIELTAKGETLVPLWGCPSGPEADCPMSKAHMDEVGEHRPAKALILMWHGRPMFFSSQMMHIIRRTDECSVKPWMLRFFVRDPNDRRIGKPSERWHADWATWVTNHPEAGLSKIPPNVVCLAPDGTVLEERGGEPVTKVERCVHGWDLGYGKKRSNDRTALCRMFRTQDKRYFCLFSAGRWGHDVVWRKIVLNATSDPIRKADEVALEMDTEKIFPEEVRKLMKTLGLADSFVLTPIQRTKDKDIVFTDSKLDVAMGHGDFFMDVDDDESVMEIASVTPNQTGGHDDIFDAAVNSYLRARHSTKLAPGWVGTPLPARF